MVEPRTGGLSKSMPSQNGAAINAFVVDGDLVLRDVVVNHHFARADNDHLYLLRVQSTNVDVARSFRDQG